MSGKKLIELRKIRGMTQEYLARRLGISLSQVDALQKLLKDAFKMGWEL
jgi:transcriptional regulator with XRE-family HTH domain